jgi:hypothetical protein
VVIFVVFCTIVFIVYCRARRRGNNVERRPSVFKRLISRPIPQRTADDDINIGDPNVDLDRTIRTTTVSPQPPQVQLNLGLQRSRPKSWSISGLGPGNHDKITKRGSQAGSKPSVSSLNSSSGVRPPWAPDSLQGQYVTRLQGAAQAASEHQQYINRNIHGVENVEPVTWASSVQTALPLQRPTSMFAPGRPISGLGHGQWFQDAERHSFYVQNKLHWSSSASEGTRSTFETITSIPTRYHRRSHASLTPYPQIPRMYDTRNSTANSQPGGILRPVSRRGPYHSTFFSGGTSHRRMSSAAARRFAAVGLGLSTIDGSPGLGAEESDDESPIDRDYFNAASSNSKTLQHTLTQNSSRYWDTTTSGTSDESMCLESLQRYGEGNRVLRPVSDYTWSLPRSCVVDEGLGDRSSHRRTSSIYSRNFDGSSIHGSEALMSSRSQSRSPTKSVNSKPSEPTPIMERTRAAYRLTDRERLPLKALGVNKRVGSKRANLQRKWKEKDIGRLVVKSKAQRPVSVDGRVGIGSLKGQTIQGNEAFL